MEAFLRSFCYAFQGIAHVLRTQRNARVHLLITCVVAAAGICLRITASEWAIVALAVGLVFSAEMFNTVVELTVDLLTQQRHPMAKVAKDVGAGAVLAAALTAVGVGIAVFGPRVWAWFFGRST